MINTLFAAVCTYFGFLPPERCRTLSFDEKIAGGQVNRNRTLRAPGSVKRCVRERGTVIPVFGAAQ